MSNEVLGGVAIAGLGAAFLAIGVIGLGTGRVLSLGGEHHRSRIYHRNDSPFTFTLSSDRTFMMKFGQDAIIRGRIAMHGFQLRLTQIESTEATWSQFLKVGVFERVDDDG